MEYPRPDFERAQWLGLNGTWRFAFDDEDVGLKNRWFEKHHYPMEIEVPFTFETELSGIGDTAPHEVVWYQRDVDIPAHMLGQALLLRFGGVDFNCRVWVNGHMAGEHTGAYTPFAVDIAPMAVQGKNTVTLRCFDSMADRAQPRGKQSWQEANFSCFYERTTGVWQSVWLEALPKLHVKNVRVTPSRTSLVGFDVELSAIPRGEACFTAEIAYEGRHITTVKATSAMREFSLTADVRDPYHRGETHRWSEEHPNLYTVTYRLEYQGHTDEIQSYFGMRVVGAKNGFVTIDDRPVYLRMVLDQGYYEKGGLTPPDGAALENDVRLIKALGFNGLRKHQKTEDPRFLYWADKLGLYVFGEMGSPYEYSPRMAQHHYNEWMGAIERDYSHPCIIGWTLVNESWGVPQALADVRQRAHLNALYHMAKSLDDTRLLVSNDGWEATQTDLINFHDYDQDYKSLQRRYSSRECLTPSAVSNGGKWMFAEGYKDEGQPVIYSELAGTAFVGAKGWGYGQGVNTVEEYLARYRELLTAVYGMDFVAGFVITQLTDVRQEVNGLLYMNRQPKCALEELAAIIRGEDLL